MCYRIVLAVLVAGALCGGLVAYTSAQANDLAFPGDENWDANIGSLGLTRTVHALAFDQNFLYLGEGYGDGLKHIRRWNGEGWASIANNVDGSVQALVSYGNGNLYAGGYFTQTGTCNNCKRVAQWDGSSWSAMGNNLCGEVIALAQDSIGTLYAGGTFGVATWNGTSWELDSSITDWIYALVVDQHDRLFTGGYAFSDSGDAFPSLRMKKASTWFNLGIVFESNTPNGISSLALYPSNVLTPTVGGSFDWPTSYLATWNGSWQSIGMPNNVVLALAADTCGGLYVGGAFGMISNQPNRFIAYYDGATWHPLGNTFATTSQSVEVLSFYHGYLAVGGVFTQTLGSQTHRNIALWTGRDCAQISASDTYTFYAWREPVVIEIGAKGTLAQIRVQRFNKDHPAADDTTTPNLKNGVYWQIEGLDAEGQPASGISYTLTLPAVGFIPDANDKICHYNSSVSAWDCAASSYDLNNKTITRSGLTSFSDFTVANDVGPTVVSLQSLRTQQPHLPLLAFVLALLSAVGLVRLCRKKP